MLQINNLSYNIGERDLLKSANWIINPGRRVALIGPNGTGKTTLLRILNGDLTPVSGTIIKPKTYHIGYLPQEEQAGEQGPILEMVLEGHPEVMRLEEQIYDIHQKLDQQTANHDELLERLGGLEFRYDALGGYKLESQAKAILTGLGFAPADLHRPLSEFSGGWRMRVYLARLLLVSPDLLLLDEPTNHLDLPALEWLEQYLLSFEGSMVLVSHDRFFIDRLAEEICELEHGQLTYYAGNYHFYEKQKALIQEQLEKKQQALADERERQQKFIDRFRYKATKAAQVQSRIKQLEKLEEVKAAPPAAHLNFTIRVETPSFKEVIKISDLSFRYAEPWVMEDMNLSIYRGDRIALVGVNGAGKTTMTRLMCSELIPQRGRVTVGERVQIGYYAQHQIEALTAAATVYDEVASTTGRSLLPRVRDVLGMFRFHGSDVFKTVQVLSGGEKARVSLAKILLSPVNFLIMDEPTNHLDLSSKEALENALTDYDGTLLLISHDRYFLDKLVHRVIELKDGRLREYEGNYSEYLAKRSAESAREEENEPDQETSTTPAKKNKEQKRLEAEARQSISKQRNFLKSEIEKTEKRIAELEKEKVEAENLMGQPDSYKDGEFAAQLSKKYATVKAELESLMEKWGILQSQFEELMAQLGL
jgi:ATP-binding cassette, subfamily F, member 3